MTTTTTTTASATPQPIIFYDIASELPHHTFAPNPWKTRYALNYKNIPYKTKPIDLPDIASEREKLGVPANRTLPDGSPYHTLPLIHDPETNSFIGDSFEIALHLDRRSPQSSSSSSSTQETPKPLFRPHTTGLTASFNSRVDALFTKFVSLSSIMPFPEASKPRIYAIFASRFGLKDMSALQPTPEAREALFVEFEQALGELAKAWRHVGGTTDGVWRAGGTAEGQAQRDGRAGDAAAGPWLDDGEEPVYADFIVGGWLAMMATCMETKDWERVRGWQGGLWGRIHDALEPLRRMD
jgi:glutathione S-transferase